MFLSAPQTYYLYGLPTTYNSSESNSYLYGEEEFDQRQGLNVYDFLARTYAPDEARFWQPDPLATDNHGISPYVYCGGDPINFVDPDGRSTYVTQEPDGRPLMAALIMNYMIQKIGKTYGAHSKWS